MSDLANNDITFSEGRLLATMTVILFVMVAASLFLADWDVTIGLILGGALSFLNYFWLKSSLRSLFDKVAVRGGGKFSASFYIIRYAVIAVVILAAAQLRLASVAAMLVGLLSFAFAILLEAVIQLYLAIVNREEN
ncbi:MAG: ATP synthase subunit I [Acidobacteriota bacterium]|nr:ATP synthase subunit I [Acidobacteriota bacterium]